MERPTTKLVFCLSLLVLKLIQARNSDQDYFTYNDCDLSCRIKNISCAITEISKTYFPCECIESPQACENLASDYTVCLRFNQPPLGGSLIWNDYKNRNPSPTTIEPPITTTSTPDPYYERQWLLMLGMLLLTVISIFSILLNGYLFWMRGDHLVGTAGNEADLQNGPLMESRDVSPA